MIGTLIFLKPKVEVKIFSQVLHAITSIEVSHLRCGHRSPSHPLCHARELRDAAGASTVITLRGYQIDITVQLPTSQNNTNIRGLLGNYNGNKDDDLISSAGQTISPTANEETIYHQFGETCEFTFQHTFTTRIQQLLCIVSERIYKCIFTFLCL